VLVLISEVWGGFSPEAMRFLGELAQAQNDGIDIERASTTWSTSSFTSYHGQLLSLAVQSSGGSRSRSSGRSRRTRASRVRTLGALEALAPGPPSGVLNSGHMNVNQRI